MNDNKFKIDINNKIKNPNILDIVVHGGLGKSKKKYPCDVIIENISNNLYSWRRILPNNKLGKIETGKQDFYRTYNRYNRIINFNDGETKVEYVIPINNIKVDIDVYNLTKDIPIF